MASTVNSPAFIEENKDFVLKLRLVGVGGTPQIRRVRLPRVVTGGAVSYDALIAVAVSYTFPDAPVLLDEYDVILTYYDVDNDLVTIASTDELVDAVDQFATLSRSSQSPPVLRLTTDVKRKKTHPVPTTPPRVVHRGASPPRRATSVPSSTTAPSSPNLGPKSAQIQSILESFVSILATAVVALQGHMNPPGSIPQPSVPVPPPTVNPVSAAAAIPTPSPVESEAKEPAEDKLAKEVVNNIQMEETSSNQFQESDSRPFIHGRHTCDACLCTPIVGTRYHATNLPDYDLCAKCRGNYKGTEIVFEPVELDRDRPFQERWHRRRTKFAAGPCRRPNRRMGHPGPPHGPPCGGGRRRHPHGRDCNNFALDFALKEAIHRSLCDMDGKAAIRPTAPVQDAVAVAAETKPAPQFFFEPKPAPQVVEPKSAPLVAQELEVVPPEDVLTADVSFASDAAGNGEVAQVLGFTLDQCAEAIDAMMDELDRGTKQVAEVISSVEENEAVENVSSSMHSLDDESTIEPTIVVETVSEEETDEKPAATEVTEISGATIVESVEGEVVKDDDDSVKSARSEDEWEVVSDDEQIVGDEMLARAAQMIGSALFESDMSRSGESGKPVSSVALNNLFQSFTTDMSSSSVPSSVPTISSKSNVPAVVLDCWAPQLVQLHELGFTDDEKSTEVLERLSAANIGVDLTDEVTVAQVVHELLEN